MKEKGRTFKELMGIFGTNQNDETKLLLKLMLEKLTSEGKIRERDKTWVHSSHQVKLNEETKNLIQEVEDYLKSIGIASADFIEIDEHLSIQIPDKKLQQILAYLLDERKIHFIQMRYLHDDFIQKSKQLVIDFLKQNEEGIAVAQFRDIIGSNRANAILVLDWLDNSGITIRKGNARFLTKRFLEKDK